MIWRILAAVCILSSALGLETAHSQSSKYPYEGWHKAPAPSRAQYRVFHDKVVALTGLSKGCGDTNSSYNFSGTVAKVNFDDQGIKILNFVYEDSDGQRSLVNVEPLSITDPGMNMADLGWISQGLQSLLHTGRRIEGSAYLCGAAGRIAVLDRVAVITGPVVATAQPDQTTKPSPSASNQSADDGIPLSMDGGTFVIPVLINDQITLNFTIDSGAADVSIPVDVVSTLIRTKTIEESDFTGQKTYRMANGASAPSATFVIRSLKVGTHVLENVPASVAPAAADLLLGQSFLSRFNSWSIDNQRQVLHLK